MKRHSKYRRDDLVRMVADGLTDAEIGQIHGVDDKCVTAARYRLKVFRRKPNVAESQPEMPPPTRYMEGDQEIIRYHPAWAAGVQPYPFTAKPRGKA